MSFVFFKRKKELKRRKKEQKDLEFHEHHVRMENIISHCFCKKCGGALVDRRCFRCKQRRD